jgi:formate dehydrogenase iron-sulfur subunit
VITRSTFSGHAHKCTLCYDRQKDGLVPACAKACPTASIQFGPIDELRARGRRRVEELHGRGVGGAHLYGDAATETYTELHSFYLLVDRPEVYGLPESPFNPWLCMSGDYLRTTIAGMITLAVPVVAFLLWGG